MLFIIIITFLILFSFYFYRKPYIYNKKFKDNILYSPCYGKVLKIIENENNYYISIFLRPYDIHYQYYPISGIVKDIIHDLTGNFNLAYELNKSNDNEKYIHYIQTKYGEIVIYQIAGYLTRRIVHYKEKNDKVKTGDLLGLIKLGSRIDIIIPKKNFILTVKEKDIVKGLDTKLGYFTV